MRYFCPLVTLLPAFVSWKERRNFVGAVQNSEGIGLRSQIEPGSFNFYSGFRNNLLAINILEFLQQE